MRDHRRAGREPHRLRRTAPARLDKFLSVTSVTPPILSESTAGNYVENERVLMRARSSSIFNMNGSVRIRFFQDGQPDLRFVGHRMQPARNAFLLPLVPALSFPSVDCNFFFATPAPARVPGRTFLVLHGTDCQRVLQAAGASEWRLLTLATSTWMASHPPLPRARVFVVTHVEQMIRFFDFLACFREFLRDAAAPARAQVISRNAMTTTRSRY